MDAVDEHFFAKNGFQFESLIAKGGYGIVYKICSLSYKQKFALKRIPSKRFVQNEVECLKYIESLFIVSLYNYYYFEG